MSPSKSVAVPSLKLVCLGNVAVTRTGRCLHGRLGGVCTKLSGRRGPSSRVGIALKGDQAVRIGIVKRIFRPKACTLSSFSAIFRTLCHTNNIDSVNDLHGVRMIHKKRGVTAMSICSFVVGNGVGSSVHLRRNSIVVIPPCRTLIDVRNGIGHPVGCRVGGGRDITALLGCTNKFSKSTCAHSLHVVHRGKGRCRVCAVSSVSCSMFRMGSNSTLATRTVLSHFRGGLRVGKTICHPNVCRFKKALGAIHRLIRGTRNLVNSTFAKHTILRHRHRGLGGRIVRMSVGNVVSNATPSMPLRHGSILCVPDVRSLRSIKDVVICNRITHPNRFTFTSGAALRSVVVRTNKLVRSTSAIHISISHHVGSDGNARTISAVKRVCSFSLGSNFIVSKRPNFILRPCSRMCIHGDPTCRRRIGIRIANRILCRNSCTLARGDRHLSSLVGGTNKIAPFTCVGKTHLDHHVGTSRHGHVRVILSVTGAKGSSVSIGQLSLKSVCCINVSLRGTVLGPNSDTSVMLHRKSIVRVPRCGGAMHVDKTIVCPGAISFRSNGALGCCVRRTKNCNFHTGGDGTCVMCVGNRIGETGGNDHRLVRPNYRIVIPIGRGDG